MSLELTCNEQATELVEMFDTSWRDLKSGMLELQQSLYPFKVLEHVFLNHGVVC